MNWLDNSSFKIHSTALVLRAERTEVLAGNVANADTPNYKARDLDFGDILRGINTPVASQMKTTHPGHINNGADFRGAELFQREANRAAPNGNTVEPEIELAAFTDNAIRFQASAQFLDGSISGLRKAWRGE